MQERIENKTEAFLAHQAAEFIHSGLDAPTDQKELIRWHKKQLNSVHQYFHISHQMIRASSLH